MPFVPTAITYLGSRVIPLFVKRRSFEYSKARSFSHGAEVVSIFLLFRVVWAAVFRTDICEGLELVEACALMIEE